MLRVVDIPEHDVDELKARVDLRTVITPGAPIRGDKPTKTRCLWHNEKNPSLFVWAGRAYCFGCGQSMDLLDFVAWREGLDVRESFDRLVETVLEKYVGLAPPPPPARARERPASLSRDIAEYMHQRLGERRGWFHGRGLTDETIDRELLGYDRRAFAIPVWSESGDLLNIRFRRDDAAFGDGAEMYSKYWGMEGHNDVYLYNAKALGLVKDWGFCSICEGELDALRLYQEGLPAVSATNGVGAFHAGLAARVKGVDPEKVLVCYDMDEPGRVNAIRVARMFGLRGRIATWPQEWGKDPTEVLMHRGIDEFVMRLMEAEPPKRVESHWQNTLRNGIWR